MALKNFNRFLCATAVILPLTQFAEAGPINAGIWYEFSFTNPGITAQGCFPADPGGDFCIPSSGTPTVFLDAPPWTFSSLLPAFLTVVDAFQNGDQFEVLDSGVVLGFTSVPGADTDCGDDPVPCLANPAMSQRVYDLGAGDRSLVVVPLAAPSGSGSAYLRIDVVPEPGTWYLAASSLAAIILWRRRQNGPLGGRFGTCRSGADRSGR